VHHHPLKSGCWQARNFLGGKWTQEEKHFPEKETGRIKEKKVLPDPASGKEGKNGASGIKRVETGANKQVW